MDDSFSAASPSPVTLGLPELPGATAPVIGAACGVPKHLYDPQPEGCEVRVPAWPGQVAGDTVALQLNGEPGLDRQQVQGPHDALTLHIPHGKLVPGVVNELTYTLARNGRHLGTSPVLTILYNSIRPGHQDRAPGEPGHSELVLRLPDELREGMAPDFEKAMVCVQYPYCRAYDRIRLNCNGQELIYQVNERQAPPPPSHGSEHSLPVYFEITRKDLIDPPPFKFAFTVHDQLDNSPDLDTPWSATHTVALAPAGRTGSRRATAKTPLVQPQAIGSINVGEAPQQVAFNPRNNQAYVCNSTSGTLSVIDTTTHRLIKTLALEADAGYGAYGVTVSPDGGQAYVSHGYEGWVSVIDTRNNERQGPPIRVGKRPYGLAITPDGHFVYVCNYSDNTLSLINTHTRAVEKTILAGPTPHRILLDPAGRHAYYTSSQNPAVAVIDRAQQLPEGRIELGFIPAGIALHPDGKHLYACNYGGGVVAVIDTLRQRVERTFSLGSGHCPGAIAVSPAGTHLYVGDGGTEAPGTLWTLNLKSDDTPLPGLAVGIYPEELAVSPDGAWLYVCNNLSDTVTVIATAR